MAIVRPDILAVMVSCLVLLFISAFTLKKVKLRMIPTVEASIEAVRVATEKGSPVLFDTGWTGTRFSGNAVNLTTLCFVPATLELAKAMSEEAGKLDVRLITATRNPVYRMMSQDFIQQGYAQSGHPERFNPDDINFFPDNTSLIASVVEMIHRENIGAAVMIGGHSQSSNVVIYEALATSGAMLVAGEIWPNDNSMAALCADYLSFAEENIAIGAYLGDDPIPKAILAGEDIIKGFLIAVTLLGGLLWGLGVL